MCKCMRTLTRSSYVKNLAKAAIERLMLGKDTWQIEGFCYDRRHWNRNSEQGLALEPTFPSNQIVPIAAFALEIDARSVSLL